MFVIVFCLVIFLAGLGWTIITAKGFAPIADFKCFYTAGKMIAEGKGHELYLPQEQEKELLKIIPGRIVNNHVYCTPLGSP